MIRDEEIDTYQNDETKIISKDSNHTTQVHSNVDHDDTQLWYGRYMWYTTSSVELSKKQS